MALVDLNAREAALIQLIRRARQAVDHVAFEDFTIAQRKYKASVEFNKASDGDDDVMVIQIRREQ